MPKMAFNWVDSLKNHDIIGSCLRILQRRPPSELFLSVAFLHNYIIIIWRKKFICDDCKKLSMYFL